MTPVDYAELSALPAIFHGDEVIGAEIDCVLIAGPALREPKGADDVS